MFDDSRFEKISWKNANEWTSVIFFFYRLIKLIFLAVVLFLFKLYNMVLKINNLLQSDRMRHTTYRLFLKKFPQILYIKAELY